MEENTEEHTLTLQNLIDWAKDEGVDSNVLRIASPSGVIWLSGDNFYSADEVDCQIFE